MIWLRLGSVILLITSAIVVLAVACCLYCFGCLDEELYTQSRVRTKSNVKQVNEFITNNQRLFCAEKDNDLLDCCICLEEYKTHPTKEIIELKCSKKHVFHSNCLSLWAKTNDICPMCREPIIKK